MNYPTTLQKIILILALITLTGLSFILPNYWDAIPWSIVVLVLGQFLCTAAVSIIHDYLDYLRLRDKARK